MLVITTHNRMYYKSKIPSNNDIIKAIFKLDEASEAW